METTLKIEGMSCGHCVRTVRAALDAVPGATVEDVRPGEARLRTSEKAAQDAAVRAVEAAGYRVASVS